MTTNTRREFRRYVSVALAGLLLSGWAQGSWASWKSEWEKVVRRAKSEGKVVVSLPPSAELRRRLEEAFERRFTGIDLEPVLDMGAKNIRRMIDESRAGVRYFDVHVGGASGMITGLVPAGVVVPLEPYMLLPEVSDPKSWWGGHIYTDEAKRFVYSFSAYLSQNLYRNTNLVNPEEIRSYDDLLNPKWKGKIGFLDPRKPGPGDATWSYMWDVKGEDYLRRLVQQDLQLTSNVRSLGESLAKGKLAITVGLSYFLLVPFIRAGLPLKALPIPKEGTYATGGAGNVVALKNPSHPSAAKVFVNWLLSKEGQEIFGKAMGHATRRLDVDTAWLYKIGYVPAKDGITVQEYYKYENQSRERIDRVRLPARKFARKLLK
ncbi:MAG: extracellular solute-binding protein [Deltaproteobacteria bacterium]|nr:extracellular solute-binding protein [Deltaproteobacteria bacterium]